MNSTTTEELILKVQQDDEQAFETLYHNYKKYIKKVSYKYTTYEFDKNDVEQLIMISIYKSCFYYKSEKNEDAHEYIKMIIKRAICDVIKLSNHKKRKINHLNSTCSIITENGDNKQICFIDKIQTTESAEHTIIEQEKYLDLMKKIESLLSKKEFKIFELYLTGYKQGQISSLLNLNYKSVDNCLSRSKRKLKKYLIV